MTCNVGGVERPIRIVVGIALLGIGAFAVLPPVGTGIVLVLGTIALVTGAIGFCPAWSLLGINTCPTKKG
jgi:Inner membrane protein YgaP-like, transmembrane domain